MKDAENTYLKGVFFFFKAKANMQQRPYKVQNLYYYLLSGPLQEKFVNHGLGQTHHAW